MGCRFPGQRRTAGKGSSTLLPDTRDHTKDWLQSYNGGAVSHCARAAGKQTEPPVSVPVRLGPIAPDPLPGSPSYPCLCALSAPHPAPQVNPPLPVAYLAASNSSSLPGFGCHQLPWPNNTPSRSWVQTCKMSLASLGKTVGRALSLGTQCHWIFMSENAVCRAPNLKGPSRTGK